MLGKRQRLQKLNSVVYMINDRGDATGLFLIAFFFFFMVVFFFFLLLLVFFVVVVGCFFFCLCQLVLSLDS